MYLSHLHACVTRQESLTHVPSISAPTPCVEKYIKLMHGKMYFFTIGNVASTY